MGGLNMNTQAISEKSFPHIIGNCPHDRNQLFLMFILFIDSVHCDVLLVGGTVDNETSEALQVTDSYNVFDQIRNILFTCAG